jgi:predicted transcriptional regulator of viral defense system
MKRAQALGLLNEIAVEQAGFVTTDQARRMSVPQETVQRLANAGFLRRYHHGVYGFVHGFATLADAETIAAWLALDGGALPWERNDRAVAVVSHASAAALHGIGTVIPELPELTSAVRRTSRSYVRVHASTLVRADWEWHPIGAMRLPITTVARTIVDLWLAGHEPDHVRRALRDSYRTRSAAERAIRPALRRRASHRTALVQRFDAVLDAAYAAQAADNGEAAELAPIATADLAATWPWPTPERTRRAISDRIRARFPANERQLRVHEVAFRRLLARLFDAQPDGWVVKGGVALILRLDPSRTSDDIDLVYVAAAGEHAIALKKLREACAIDLGDQITFDVLRVGDEDRADRSLAVRVRAAIGGSRWVEFDVDLALPATDVPAEPIQPRAPLVGVPAVDAIPNLMALRLPAQIAQKTCAMFEVHGRDRHASTRARDLVDIAMISDQIEDLSLREIILELEREESERLERGVLAAPLPPTLTLATEQLTEWPARWTIATRSAPLTFADALERASTFLEPVLARRSGDLTWSATRRRWG